MIKKKKKISKLKHAYTIILIVLLIVEFLFSYKTDPGIAIVSLIVYILLIIFIYRESVLAYWILFVLIIFDTILNILFQIGNVLNIITGFIISLIILVVAVLAYIHDVK